MLHQQKHEQPSMKYLIVGLAVYIITGIAQPMLIDILRINSLLGHKHLLLPTLANTTGMALCGLLASKSQWNNLRLLLRRSNNVSSNNSNLSLNNGSNNNNLKRMILITSIVDLMSGMCLTFGILFTGGAIFVVLYNSCPAWTAVLSRFLLGKKMTLVQFTGVMLVCVGLVANVLGTKLQMSNNSITDSHNDNIRSMAAVVANDNDNEINGDRNEITNYSYEYGVFFGSIIVLLGSLLHSLMFVLSDISLRSVKKVDEVPTINTTNNVTTTTISGEIWSCCLGTIEATFMAMWVFIGILTTGFNDRGIEIVDQGVSQNNSFVSILGGFSLLVLVDAAHAAAFFTLLKNIGAVSSALLKGVQTVIVIALSAIFFCPTEQSQCLNTVKVSSACLVLTGVFCYGVGGRDGAVPSAGAPPDDMKNKRGGNCHDISGSIPMNHSPSGRNVEMKNLI